MKKEIQTKTSPLVIPSRSKRICLYSTRLIPRSRSLNLVGGGGSSSPPQEINTMIFPRVAATNRELNDKRRGGQKGRKGGVGKGGPEEEASLTTNLSRRSWHSEEVESSIIPFLPSFPWHWSNRFRDNRRRTRKKNR